MNSQTLQEYAKTQDQLTHFLTYADNNAVGYFAKQGFTKEITLEQEWVSHSKFTPPARPQIPSVSFLSLTADICVQYSSICLVPC